jgi:hypothetical protein
MITCQIKKDYILKKKLDTDVNTVNVYEKIVVIISCYRRGEDKTL